MDSDAIIHELEVRASELESEAQRLRSAVDVLRGLSPAHTPRASDAGPAQLRPAAPETRAPRATRLPPLLRTTLNELGPMGNIELTDALLSRGWETSSSTPSNTVRTALGRLMEKGDVVRLDDGRFASMAYVEANALDE